MDTRTNTMIEALKSAGLRMTPQRMAICALLAGSKEHPTAQMVHEALRGSYPSLSLATVYNTLEELVRLGVLNSLGSAGDDAEHYDADLSPHVNLACLRCGRVIDLPSEHIHAVEREVVSASGYQLVGARVMYYGTCPDCQRKLNEQ